MTRLELVQKLHEESGSAGTISSTTNQTGEAKQLVGWIDKAYLDILNSSRYWKFMRTDLSLPLVVGTDTYTVSGVSEFTNLEDWRAWKTVITDEQYVEFVDWDEFKFVFQLGTARTQTGRPRFFSVKPDRKLMFNPVPDYAYTVVGEYQAAPVAMTVNDSVPVFPEAYHYAIVWKALMFYAAFHSEPDKYAHGSNEFKIVMAGMRSTELPGIIL